jgi:hypothetical protein
MESPHRNIFLSTYARLWHWSQFPYKWVRNSLFFSAGLALAYVAWDGWFVHDRSDLPRDVVFFVFSIFILVLTFWLRPRWKYYERTRPKIGSIARIFGFGGLAISFWSSNSRLIFWVPMAIICAWELFALISEVKRQEALPSEHSDGEAI